MSLDTEQENFRKVYHMFVENEKLAQAPATSLFTRNDDRRQYLENALYSALAHTPVIFGIKEWDIQDLKEWLKNQTCWKHIPDKGWGPHFICNFEEIPHTVRLSELSDDAQIILKEVNTTPLTGESLYIVTTSLTEELKRVERRSFAIYYDPIKEHNNGILLITRISSCFAEDKYLCHPQVFRDLSKIPKSWNGTTTHRNGITLTKQETDKLGFYRLKLVE